MTSAPAGRMARTTREQDGPIRVTIGRITIAEPAKPAPTAGRAGRPRPALSLGTYLSQRRS